MSTPQGPGRSDREGITIFQLTEMFPDEEAAVKWFESNIWPDDNRHCGHCGSTETRVVKDSKPMPYWCTHCRSYFSVRTGSAMQSSRLPLRKWAFATYIFVTSLKSVSSMKLHRELGVTQKTAWFMLHRLREAWKDADLPPMKGPVEADETYIGGIEKNKHGKKKLRAGRGAVGKTAVAGVKDRKTGKVRAQVVDRTDRETLHGFVEGNTAPDAKVYTDEAHAYKGMDRQHKSVKHSVGQYVNNQVHTNGVESFWSTLKRAHKGTFHKLSPKHLDRYVGKFAGKHNHRDSDTIDQMTGIVCGMIGKRLLYRNLIADNGLSSGARTK